jgi:hypothetical protein
LESAQLQIDGKQRTAGNCLAVSSPHESQLDIHALIAQRLSLHAICATAREQIALVSSDEHLKILMTVRSRSKADVTARGEQRLVCHR